MRFSLLSLIILSILYSCKDTAVVYSGAYPKDKFVVVIADLYVAEAALKDVSEANRDSLKDIYRSQIAAIHNVDLSIIEKDLVELQQLPAIYNEIHSQVTDSIVMMEKNLIDSKVKKIGQAQKTN